MQSKLYHPAWRILFIVGFVAINSSYVFKLLSIEVPQFWMVAKYVVGYSVVGFGIIQVLFSSIIRNGEKVMWCISLVLLAALALLLYVIVYKRIHGFYIHHSKI